ncbi:oligopeptide:H+ symporter [Novacetimonas maltaceti]|uniref:Dipeptide and tripeptide permease B n=1 Tax=Novacetimonas maltaceti TaxID=1203393 RepID=A0A2S3VX14_9PROT|nr:oligopeptide:H+ symporter [Novacetimonas maltaceti]POF61174.1 Dipeptide and tripeptide permease B [Novacetimonas maltaceti]
MRLREMSAAAPARRSGLGVALFLEATERFSFYGMLSILLIFALDVRGLGAPQANLFVGSFNALALVSTLLGSRLGDVVLGPTRTVLYGCVIQFTALVLLGLSVAWPVLFLPAAATVAVTNGLTRTNMAILVLRHAGGGRSADGLATLYTFAINLGAMFSFLLVPWIGKHYGYALAFGACAAGLFVGAATALPNRRGLSGKVHDGAPVPTGEARATARAVPWAVAEIGLAVLFYWVVLNFPAGGHWIFWAVMSAIPAFWAWVWRTAAPAQRPGIAICLILIAEAMFYGIFDEQTTSTFVLYALHNLNRQFSVAGVTLFELDAPQIVAINAGLTMLLGPAFVALYRFMDTRFGTVALSTKYACGSVFIVIGFLILCLDTAGGTSGLRAPWGMFGAYGALSVAGLIMNGLGLSVVTTYLPPRVRTMSVAVYYISTGLAMYGGSVLANIMGIGRLHAAVSIPDSLSTFHAVFRGFTVLAACGAAGILLMLPVLRMLEKRACRMVSKVGGGAWGQSP